MAIPASPLLASNIYLSSLSPNNEPPPKKRKVSLNHKSLDAALEGGLEHGSIHCITSDPGTDNELLTQTLLASHLRALPRASATMVDGSIGFDVRGLYRVLDGDGDGRSMEMLERVKIMKVFDFVGMGEAVAEVRDGLEGRVKPERKVFKSTIPDSEDEESEEEMLDDPSPVKPKAPPPRTEDVKVHDESPGLLIIDNISQIFAPLIKNNYTQGQALLASFLRSLGHLTRTHDLCTILLGQSSAKPATASGEESLSIFKSCAIRPTLGIGIGYLVDVHLYVHRLPVKKSSHPGKDEEMANVLEVVQDRHGGRFGRWAAFVATADRSCLAEVS